MTGRINPESNRLVGKISGRGLADENLGEFAPTLQPTAFDIFFAALNFLPAGH